MGPETPFPLYLSNRSGVARSTAMPIFSAPASFMAFKIVLFENGRADQDGYGKRGFFFQKTGHFDRVSPAFSIGNHGDTGTLHIRRGIVDGRNDLLHRVDRPVHMDKTLFLISAGSLPGQAAIGAIGCASFRIVDQKVHTFVDGTPIHPLSNKA